VGRASPVPFSISATISHRRYHTDQHLMGGGELDSSTRLSPCSVYTACKLLPLVCRNLPLLPAHVSLCCSPPPTLCNGSGSRYKQRAVLRTTVPCVLALLLYNLSASGVATPICPNPDCNWRPRKRVSSAPAPHKPRNRIARHMANTQRVWLHLCDEPEQALWGCVPRARLRLTHTKASACSLSLVCRLEARGPGSQLQTSDDHARQQPCLPRASATIPMSCRAVDLAK